MWIIHSQIVGTESSYILKSYDDCFVVVSSFHSTAVFYSTVFVLSCYSTTHEVFTASIQFVGSISIFGLAKLAITIVKQPNIDALTSNDFYVFKNALRLYFK